MLFGTWMLQAFLPSLYVFQQTDPSAECPSSTYVNLTHPSSFSYITPPPGSLCYLCFFPPERTQCPLWAPPHPTHPSHMHSVTTSPSPLQTGSCQTNMSSPRSHGREEAHVRSSPGSRALCAIEHCSALKNLKLWLFPPWTSHFEVGGKQSNIEFIKGYF